jgi:transposase
MIPNDLPPWTAVYQQVQRWIKFGVFEEMVHDLRQILRIAAGREADPMAVVIESRALRSTPRRGHWGAYDGAKRKQGSEVHITVDTLGYPLALRETPADNQDRSQVRRIAKAVQKATGRNVELAYTDPGYTGEQAQDDAEDHGVMLHVASSRRRSEASCCRRCAGWSSGALRADTSDTITRSCTVSTGFAPALTPRWPTPTSMTRSARRMSATRCWRGRSSDVSAT